MNKAVKIKDIVIGEGMPKICIPLTGETEYEIINQAEKIKNIDFDIAEWRADFYEHIANIEKVKEILREIRKIIVTKPLIFTLRSTKEGGKREVSKEYYFELNKTVIKTGYADILDIELFNDEKLIEKLVSEAHINGMAVIISNHDFKKTPGKEEIVSILRKACQLGADIPKIAVMPNCTEDVINLLDATRIAKEQYINGPLITVSMSGKGIISRLAGEIFGSSVTFGSAERSSAPGQIPAEDLRKIIELIHNNLQYGDI